MAVLPTEDVMSDTARQLLDAFDTLPETEREAVVAELLTRHPVGAGELPDAGLVELAEELFRAYDAEEAAEHSRPHAPKGVNQCGG